MLETNEDLLALTSLLGSTLRLCLPLLLIALSGLFSEKAGVANIGLEAQVSAAAFLGAAVTTLSSNPEAGILGALLGSVIVASIFSFFCIHARGDDIVVGTAMNIFVLGAIPIFNKILFGVTGSTPSLPINLRFISLYPFLIVTLILYVFSHWFFNKSVWGLRLRVAGENPRALVSQGLSAIGWRYFGVLVGSLATGLAGLYISVGQGSGYLRNMTAGRGFISLAAIILGGWKPLPTAIACVAFAFFDAVQMRLQSTSVLIQGIERAVPSQFVQVLPYALTLVGLALVGGRMRPPKSINVKL